MNKTLTIRLAQTQRQKKAGKQSLGELLTEALAVINPKGSKWPDAQFLAHEAIVAVCEEILRTGHVAFPLETSFTYLWSRRSDGFRFQASLN